VDDLPLPSSNATCRTSKGDINPLLSANAFSTAPTSSKEIKTVESEKKKEEGVEEMPSDNKPETGTSNERGMKVEGSVEISAKAQPIAMVRSETLYRLKSNLYSLY
jgi:hypothetical protein